ncbi:MAG TPA: hypothetical protein VH722_01820 [Alphaproteobacteria bacterium]|jgi:hypothetical protein|nr:hypothetical protein [Alphaproteobacteria bacterium]
MEKIDRGAKGRKLVPFGEAEVPLAERIKALQDRVLASPPTGEEADKEFFDWLSGDG